MIYEKYLTESQTVEKHGVKAVTGMQGPAHASAEYYIEITKGGKKAKFAFFNEESMMKVWKVIAGSIKDFKISSVGD